MVVVPGAFRRSQILSCWRHHALRAPIMGCSPPSRHSYRPRTIRSTVAAPMAMARFRPPPRARFPRSTYAVVVRVFRALRLRTSSYPVCGASLFLFSLLRHRVGRAGCHKLRLRGRRPRRSAHVAGSLRDSILMNETCPESILPVMPRVQA